MRLFGRDRNVVRGDMVCNDIADHACNDYSTFIAVLN